MSILNAARIDALADAANFAPSADNMHVFRLQVAGDRLQLRATEPLRHAHASRRMLGLVSVGAASENLVLRGASLGLNVQPRFMPAAGDPSLLADFKCREVPAVSDPLEQAMSRRHTNRRLRFHGPRFTPPVQHQFESQAAMVPGAVFVWLDEDERRRQALRLIRKAEAERFRNPALHRELFGSVRFDVGWRAQAAHGLPPGSLELPAIERPAFSLLRHWSIQRVANVLGVHRFIGWRAADLPCRLAPHLCAIASSLPGDLGAIAAGRSMQRVWLLATVLESSFQVFGASPLYALEGSTDIEPAFRAELADGWRALCPEARPFIVFRMGFAAEPSVRSGRPDPRHLIVTNHAGGSAERIVSEATQGEEEPQVGQVTPVPRGELHTHRQKALPQ
jgi:hypothetical protein